MKDKIKEELLDELLKDYKSPEDLIGPGRDYENRAT